MCAVFDTLLHGMPHNTNDAIRHIVSKEIGEIWSSAKKDKANNGEIKRRLRNYIYNNAEAIGSVIDAVGKTKSAHIDVDNDPFGINIPAKLPNYLVGEIFTIARTSDKISAIETLIQGFKRFVENNTKFKRELLYDKKRIHKKESAWQSAFQSYIDFSLKQLNIDITPEFETGRGPVDFKFSEGEDFKVLVELKLSSNPLYKAGLEKQLEAYKQATTNVRKSYFIFIDLDYDATKSQEKRRTLNNIRDRYNLDSTIVVIDGLLQESASKLHTRKATK
jgi:hypothetical protein